jgi:hypothetical protein
LQFTDPGRDLFGGSLQLIGDTRQLYFVLLESGQGFGTTDRFNTTNAGGDAVLADDLDQTYLAGRPDMGPATKFFAGFVYGDNSNLLFILFAKQGGGSILYCRITVKNRRFNFTVSSDLPVNLLLNLVDLILGQWRKICKVKAKPFRVNKVC